MTLRVIVVMGGPSAEHDVSLKSGRGVVEALRRRHLIAEPLVIPQTLTVSEACEFTTRALKPLQPDVVFIALHGAFGEDGAIQRLCDELRVSYTGSDAAASRLGMDKIASRRRFEAAGLAVPPWRMLEATQAAGWRPEGLSCPLVVKPASQGSSLGVSIIHDPAQLRGALELAAQYDARLIVEAFVPGREMTVGVLGDEALPIVEICPSQPFFDFKAKYTVGATTYVVPAPLPPELTQAVQTAGVSAHQAIGCRHLSRTDIILRADGVPVVLEVNTIPGFTSTSLLPKAAACRGISYEMLCEQLVMMACPLTKLPIRVEPEPLKAY